MFLGRIFFGPSDGMCIWALFGTRDSRDLLVQLLFIHMQVLGTFFWSWDFYLMMKGDVGIWKTRQSWVG